MLRPNTELTAKSVMQEIPRYVDISKGTLTGKDKRSEALNKATKFKNIASLIPDLDSESRPVTNPQELERELSGETDPFDINQPMMLFPQA